VSFIVPNLASVIAAATLFYCLFVFGGATQLFRDSDAGWHIRLGEWILKHRALPPSDLYSFSRGGTPWFAWEWGSDVLLGGADLVGGLRGVTVLMSTAIAACSWLWVRLSLSAGGDFFLTALFAPLMLTTASLHWLARPHLFSWIFLLGAMLYLERCSNQPEKFRWSELMGVAAITALWANLHASFFLFPLAAVIYGLAANSRVFFAIAGVATAASFVNPYGWRLHEHVLRYLTDDDLTSRVAEFQSFNFHDKDATQIVLVMALCAAGTIFALVQKRFSHFLLGGVFLVGALRSARLIPLVALLILPLANRAIKTVLEETRVAGWLEDSRGLLRIDRGLSGGVFLVIMFAVAFVGFRGQKAGFPADRFPVAATDAVAQLPIEARLLAPDSFGGYLIYRFNGERKVYNDGRSDFYGAEFMKQYLRLMQARPGWQETVNSFGFTHALLPNDSALTAALTQAGWTTLHQDSVATLLEKH
jgi:hypothetical protein